MRIAIHAHCLYAQLVQQPPERFLAFACVPLPHVGPADRRAAGQAVERRER